MQVTNVRTTVVGTPWRELVFVELETDTGLTGVGEVRPVNKTDSFIAVVEELAARYVVGADPFDTERLAWAIERLEYGRPGEHGHHARRRKRLVAVDPLDPGMGGHGQDRARVEEAARPDIGREARPAGHLRTAVDARDRAPDRARQWIHAAGVANVMRPLPSGLGAVRWPDELAATILVPDRLVS